MSHSLNFNYILKFQSMYKLNLLKLLKFYYSQKDDRIVYKVYFIEVILQVGVMETKLKVIYKV